MDKRTLLIIVALLAPVAALALMVQSAPQNASAPTPPAGGAPAGDLSRPLPPPRTLEEAKRWVKHEAARLEKMTPEQWEADRKARVRRRPPPGEPNPGMAPPPPPPPSVEASGPDELPPQTESSDQAN